MMKPTAPVAELDALATSLRHGHQLLSRLRADGGTRGVRLAGTLSFLKDVDLSVVPESTAEAIAVKIALYTNAVEICVGELAVFARTWQQAFPDLSDAHLQETVDSFYNELQTVMGTCGLPGLCGIREAPGVLLDVWRRAVNACPEVPASRTESQMDEGEADTFPSWFVGGFAAAAKLQPCLTTLCSAKSSAAFLLLPPAARILYMRCAASLGGKDYRKVIRWFRLEAQTNPVHLAVVTRAMETYIANTCLLPDGGESNLWRHARRLVYLLTTLVCSVCSFNIAFADTHALQAAVMAPWHDLLGLAAAPNLPGLPELDDRQRSVGDMLTTTDHGAQERWHLNSPGVIPMLSTAVLSRAEALRFVQDQARVKDSTIRIPSFAAKQKEWEEWFSRVLDLQTTCSELPVSLVIPTLIPALSITDRRIYGWSEYVAVLKSKSLQPTLTQFVAFICKNVLATNTTRQAAAAELRGLSVKMLELHDCSALATKLRQLFTQLYPPVATPELQPMERILACQILHVTLAKLYNVKGTKKPVVQAWQATSYDPAKTFELYVEEKVHREGDTTVVTAAFLNSVCQQLEQAHSMHSQLQAVSEGLTVPPTTPAQPVVNALGHYPAHDYNSNKSSNTRLNLRPGINPLIPGNGRGRGKSVEYGRPSDGAPTGEPPAQRARTEAPVRVALNDNQLAALASMAAERRPLGCLLANPMPPGEALSRAKKGACLLCLQNGHRATKCHLRATNPQVVNVWFNRYRGKVQALRDGRPMPPLTAAQPPKQV